MGLSQHLGLPQRLSSKESACNAGAAGSIPGSRRSHGGGHSNQLQYSCLKNPMGRGAWWATVHRVTKSWTRLKRLSTKPHRTSTQTQEQKGKRKDAQTIKWMGFLEKPRGSMQVSQQKKWLPGFSECSWGRWPTVQRSSLGFPGKSTGVGCLLQGIFPTQGSNPGLPHCRQTLYPLSHQGSPEKHSRGTQRWGRVQPSPNVTGARCPPRAQEPATHSQVLRETNLHSLKQEMS